MKYKTLEIQIENDVATVHLNRPDVHNAMNEDLMRELTDFFKKIANENGTRIIILTGKGKSFCAGADLNWMKSMANYDKKENSLTPVVSFIHNNQQERWIPLVIKGGKPGTENNDED